MSKRARRPRYKRPLGAFTGRSDNTDVHMRTVILLAIEELQPDLRRRIADGRPRTSPQDYDDARKEIAEHFIVRIREIVRCGYGSSGTKGGHG